MLLYISFGLTFRARKFHKARRISLADWITKGTNIWTQEKLFEQFVEFIIRKKKKKN